MTIRGAETVRFSRSVMPSVLDGVTNEQWDAFQRAVGTQPISAVSKARGVGSYNLRPRRLGELGVMTNMRREHGRWAGDYVQPYSEAALRSDFLLQYKLFAVSTKKYDGDLERLARPAGVSRSGALAILHCGGVGALQRWPDGAFDETKDLFERTNNLF